MNTIDQLTAVLLDRKNADPQNSYVASLYAAGRNKILEKVGEEATEVIIAGKEAPDPAPEGRKDTALINEVADLWFHSMVLLVQAGQDPRWVLESLESRFGQSGHEEKASRPQTGQSPAES